MRRALWVAVAVLGLVGCSGKEDEDTTPEDTSLDPGDSGLVRVDNDGDGVSVSEGDCNDNDPATRPGAEESCDTEDNDCDGQVDEGVRIDWFRDADDDGVGNAEQPITTCAPPPGYVQETGDCDDTDPRRFPGNEEICDTVDNDCNDVVDDPGAFGERSWYTDSDGDGFGDAEVDFACYGPVGSTAQPGDCDDTNALVNPDGLEDCATADDDDCSGSTDAEDALNCTAFYLDGDGDGVGGLSVVLCACEAPSDSYVPSGGDCDDAEDGVTLEEVIGDGIDNDCDGQEICYYDGDGDGVTVGTTIVSFDADCTDPGELLASALAAGTDCDDTNGDRSPLLVEDCNGIDDDCDGSVDEEGACEGCTASAYRGHHYLVCETAQSFGGARAACVDNGYDLVVVNSVEENTYIGRAILPVGTAWIGYADQIVEGSWGWVWDSSSFTNWEVGEPNNLGDEDCATMLDLSPYYWNDSACALAFPYVCERAD